MSFGRDLIIIIDPEWASVNICVFLCIDCAGIHRRLGTNVSRVKSVKLDRWTKEEVEVRSMQLQTG